MNTAPQYLSRFLCVAPLQSKMRNGMEEVVGSIPTRSTKSPNNLAGRVLTATLFVSWLVSGGRGPRDFDAETSRGERR